MSRHLEIILDDLRAGLRHRADRRRRRARAAGATATTGAALALAFLLAGPVLTGKTAASPGDGSLTVRLLAGDTCADGIGCLPAPQLNLPKRPKD